MASLKTKVDINSTTLLDSSDTGAPKLVLNWEYERTSEGGISELTINVLRKANDTVSFTVGQTVEIWKGFTTSTDVKIFNGNISQIEPDGGVIKITCKDKMWDLVRKNVNKIYFDSGSQAGQISAIAQDLIETYGGLTANVVATGTLAGETIEQFKCIHSDVYSRLMTLAKAVDYQVYYKASNDTVYFEPRGTTDSGITLTTGTEIMGVPKWDIDTSKLVNDLRIDGAVVPTQIQETGQIGVTSGYTTADILLTKTPDVVELLIDASDPPTTQREGGTKDASTAHYYYVDKENKKLFPKTDTTFTGNDYAIINYSWLAPAPIHMENEESQTLYGIFQEQRTLSDIITILDAEARAQEILNKFGTPFETANMLVKSDSSLDINVGEKVTIVDNVNEPNINKQLVILTQTVKYPGSFQEIDVGDKPLRLSDWQVNVEERIKRIEEQSLQNDDLIMELFNNSYTFQTEPRYRKITTKSIAGDILIWNNSDFGTWNSYKWGSSAQTSFVLGHSIAGILGTTKLGIQASAEINHFVQQYQDSYTENFIDSDFEDTSGTASWSTTGSVTFTSGQIAQSLTIDFNNSAITVAKLTSTETSGSFTYELSADGGSNWESVTSGTAHTFTSSGTDLRFKITENAASTGEISQIKLEDYH